MSALALAGLLLLTAAVAALPLLPAWLEWRRPTDVAPLPIDQRDALEPEVLAQRFAGRLRAALAAGRRTLGLREIGFVDTPWLVPLTADEQHAGHTRRIWHARSDLMLPRGMHFAAEVLAEGRLHTARGGRYHALWAGDSLALAPASRLGLWAHARRVDVAPGCVLQGRVSADEGITVERDARFTLLHAPMLLFGTADAPPPPHAAPAAEPLPPPVAWDAVTQRGTCDVPLALPAGRRWRGDLVCAQPLSIGDGCVADGSVKGHGDLHLGAACRVQGSLVAQGRIELGAGCSVSGPVVSETEVVLGEGCTVGAPGRPATVAAPRIVVGAGCVVHGTVWAGEGGQALARRAAPVVARMPEAA